MLAAVSGWVILGLVGVGLTIITGAAYLGPASRGLQPVIEARGPDDPEVRRIISRLVTVGRIDLVVLFLVIADMVLKPGA